jgi:hypothetical protein
MKRAVWAILLFLSARIFADMGAIVPNGRAEMTEPAQKAFILHNGHEEVLILGTDIRVEPAQSVLRFIPFPSKPSVALAPEKTFDGLNRLVRKKGLLMVIQTKGLPEKPPADELVSSERLGAHDITVLKITDADRFRTRVKELLLKRGLSTNGLGEKAVSVAADYISRGFIYFVLDLVDMGPGVRSVDPVQYRFASKLLYYPLRTSKLFGGNGKVQLVICAPTARDLYGMIDRPYEVSTTSPVFPKELKEVFGDGSDFFKRSNKPPVLQAVRIEGNLDFGQDILFDPLAGLKEVKTR